MASSMQARQKMDMKVVLLGREYGGKTSLADRYIYDRFKGEKLYKESIGAAYGGKKLTIGDRTLLLSIWDTAGSERYEAMSRHFYRSAKAAIICYDLTDNKSFDKVRFWINELKANEETCKIYLCGTKKDLIDDGREERIVYYRRASALAKEFDGEVFETSSKTGENIRELFSTVALDYINDPANKVYEEDTRGVKIRHRDCCCCCCRCVIIPRKSCSPRVNDSHNPVDETSMLLIN